MGKIDSGSKSSRLLASRRYTHNTLTAAQESFTNVLDLQASEIYTQANKIPSSGLPYSGSSQNASYYTVGSDNILKYWYRQKLTKSNVNNEVWFFLDPSGSDSGVGAQLINANQEVNFVSPKYSTAALATSTTEDSTPGYLVLLYKSTSATSGSVSGDDVVSTNDYQFDYKTGIVQFYNSEVDPSNSQYVFMTVYQYVGKTLATGVEISGDISGSVSSTGSFGRLEVAGDGTIAGDLTLGGNITFGDADTDSVSFTADITSNLIPDASDSYNLGSTSKRWNDLYLSGSISASGGPVDIDSTTTVDIDAVGAMSLQGGAASDFTTSAGAITVDGKTGVTLKEDGTAVIAIDTNRDVLFSGTGGSTSDPDVEFDGYTRFDGVTEVADSTDSTSVSTGAFIVDGGVGIAKDLVVGGMVTAQEFHTEFVSASIMYISGSNKFGDTIDDIHSFTGSIHQSGSFNLNDGNMTITDTLTATNIGAFTSTGAIDFDSQNMTNVDIDSGTIDGTTIGAASHTTIKGTTVDATTDFTIDGLVLTADTITNDAGLSIVASSGDITLNPAGNNVLPGGDSEDDLGVSGTAWRALYVDSIKMNGQGSIDGATHITASGNISSSGNIFGTGNLDINGTANVAGITTLQSDLNASGNITGSGNLEISGNISGSATSTGSFGRIDTTGDIYASGRLYEAGSSVVDHGTAMAIVFGG